MRTVGVVFALLGITASAFVWGSYLNRAPDQSRQAATIQAPADGATASVPNLPPRVFSAKRPLLSTPHLEDFERVDITASTPVSRRRQPPTTAAAQDKSKEVKTAAPAEDEADRPVTFSSRRPLSSLQPGDEEARAQLVRDIQYELRRVGCYSGPVQGSWNGTTKQAMKLFTERVNASLPLEQPDYALLTLVENQKSAICGSECPQGQLASGDGRCVPRAIMAQQRGEGSVAPNATSDAPHQDRAPLPGRMLVGAQTDDIAPQAEAPQTERRTVAKRQARSSIKRGSTRQVFSRLMMSAP